MDASHTCHIDTEALGAFPLYKLVKEYYLVLFLIRPECHMEVLDSLKLFELVQQHVVVSGEQRETVEASHQEPHHCMCNRVSIECGSTSAQLIQDGQGSLGCELKHIPCLFHFYIEGRLAFKDSI